MTRLDLRNLREEFEQRLDREQHDQRSHLDGTGTEDRDRCDRKTDHEHRTSDLDIGSDRVVPGSDDPRLDLSDTGVRVHPALGESGVNSGLNSTDANTWIVANSVESRTSTLAEIAGMSTTPICSEERTTRGLHYTRPHGSRWSILRWRGSPGR